MRRLVMVATALALAACSHGESGGNNSSGAAAEGGQTEKEPQNLTEDTRNVMVPVQLPSPRPVAALPDAFRGRWAAVPDDCRNGGPGSLVVEATALTVGATRSAARSLASTGPDAFAVDLAVDGGIRREQLTLIDGGRTLVRQQQQPATATNYLRCPA